MPTVDKLRADIDAGRTRDKVAWSDPAAAPLGADEEAAGTPVSRERVELARSNEIGAPPKSNEDGGALFYVAAVALVIVVLATGTFLLLR